MIPFSVLKSFSGATQENLDLQQLSEEEQQGSSSGDGYHSPGMDNCILAPDGYSYG